MGRKTQQSSAKHKASRLWMLLPADTSTGWFSLALESVDEVR
ncbi:DNA N-6-adenine-methyltransferase [Hafnia alvei]